MAFSSVPFDIAIYGPQASGKGTQGKQIAARYSGKHLSTGTLLREAAQTDPELGALMTSGALVSTVTVLKVLEPAVENIQEGSPVIWDGFPRSPEQVDEFLDFLRDRNRQCVVVVLEVSEAVSLERMCGRLAAEGRADDADAGAVRKRLDAYQASTVPTITALEQAGVRVLRINGEQTVENVSAAVFAALDGVMQQSE